MARFTIRSAKQLFGLFFKGVGLLLAVIALVQVISTWIYMGGAQTTEGTVVDHERVQNQIAFMQDTGYLYYPIVEFPGPSGETVTFVSPSGRSSKQFEEGDAVSVLYAADAPGDARIDSFRGVWGKSLVFGGLAVIFFLIGLLTPFGFRDSQRAYP
jgi:hypothetical protein